MKEIPEGCPVRDILRDIEKILDLLEKVMEHCEKCLTKGGEGNAGT